MKLPFNKKKEGNTQVIPSFLIFNSLKSIIIRNFA